MTNLSPTDPSSPPDPGGASPWRPERDGPDPAEGLGYTVTAYLLAGPLTYGGIGFGLSRWLGWAWALPVGLLVGLALSLYLVWFRYGRA